MNIVKRAVRRGKREITKAVRLRKLQKMGLKYISPTNDYIYRTNLPENGIVIDVGCSYEAEFSLYMIEHHGLKAFAVDPTRKHQPALKKLEQQYKGMFVHLPIAISAVDGLVTFHESKENESGSILEDHVNVQNDEIVEYEVESVTIRSLLSRIGVDHVAILKLDLEGAEYELLDKTEGKDLKPFDQIFVEFHHHAIKAYNQEDTQRLVKKIVGCGFQSFSLDNQNYIFLGIPKHIY